MNYRHLIVCIVITLLAGGCVTQEQHVGAANQPTPDSSPKDTQQESVKIGALLSLSGPAAAYGQSAREGIEMAVADINANGGVNGKRIEIIYEDDGTDAAGAVTAFNKLVSVDHVSAIIGGTWDFNYNAIAPLAARDHVTLITPQNPKTDGLTVNEYTFVMQPSLRHITAGLENYVQQGGAKRLAVVHFASPYGQAVTDGMRDIAEKTGAELVLEESYTQLGGNDFLTISEKIKAARPDAVFIDMGASDDVLTFAKRMKQNNPTIQILGHRIVADTASTAGTDRSLLEGIVYFDYTKPVNTAFATKYAERYSEQPLRNADSAYDSVFILAEALANTRPENVHTYIAQHTFVTPNGNITFVDHVVGAKQVFIEQITANGAVTLEQKMIG